MSEPQRNLTVDSLEVVDGRDHEKIEGWVPELATEAELREGLEKAWCPRFASRFWTLTWAEERLVRRANTLQCPPTGRLQLPQCILKSSERSNKSRSLRRAWEFESAGDCGRLMVGDPG